MRSLRAVLVASACIAAAVVGSEGSAAATGWAKAYYLTIDDCQVAHDNLYGHVPSDCVDSDDPNLGAYMLTYWDGDHPA